MSLLLFVSFSMLMSSALAVQRGLSARSNQVLLSYTGRRVRKDCLVWTDGHQHYDDADDVDDRMMELRVKKDLVIMLVKYTQSYYTCSECDTGNKKYGNLMKHMERPIFPRHVQSTLTLIVVQKTENHGLYFTVFRSVESNMEIRKLQWTSTLGCCE